MVSITPDAAAKLLKMIARENAGQTIPETAGLRLCVRAGGCSGFQSCLEIERAPKENDQVFESNGVRIFVDLKSVEYLDGSEISLETNLLLGVNKFKVTNPKAKSTCGCGKSFEPKDK